MKLEKFAEVCEDITSTRSSNYKQDVISSVYTQYKDLLSEMDGEIPHTEAKSLVDGGILPDEDPITEEMIIENAEVFTRFITGKRFQDPETKTNFKSNRMHVAASRAFNVNEETVEYLDDEHGKASIAIGKAFLKSGDASVQATFGDVGDISARSISDVYEQVTRLPFASSDTEREAIVEKLLEGCESEKEAKWVSFCVLGDISMYMGWKTAAKAMADVWGLEKDDIYRARSLSWGDFPTVLRDWLTSNVLRTEIEVGIPFKPMLAKAGEIPDLGGEFLGQTKFDGARVLIHSDGDQIWVYTRGLKDITDSVPEITENIEPDFPFIVDGEAVGYDPDSGEVLPFEKVMNRIGREYDVEEMREEVEIRTWLFDCLYLDSPIDSKPFSYRQGSLEDFILSSVPNSETKRWNGATYIGNGMVNQAPTLEDLEEAFELATKEHEGIIAKDTEAPYMLERDEAWTKIKPTSTIELRVTEARQGTGENANKLGRVYVETADGTALGRVGIGFTDEEREKWDPENGEESLEGKIIEVTAEEISITETDGKSEYGIRFPRFERVRPESGAEVDALDRCIELLN